MKYLEYKKNTNKKNRNNRKKQNIYRTKKNKSFRNQVGGRRQLDNLLIESISSHTNLPDFPLLGKTLLQKVNYSPKKSTVISSNSLVKSSLFGELSFSSDGEYLIFKSGYSNLNEDLPGLFERLHQSIDATYMSMKANKSNEYNFRDGLFILEKLDITGNNIIFSLDYTPYDNEPESSFESNGKLLIDPGVTTKIIEKIEKEDEVFDNVCIRKCGIFFNQPFIIDNNNGFCEDPDEKPLKSVTNGGGDANGGGIVNGRSVKKNNYLKGGASGKGQGKGKVLNRLKFWKSKKQPTQVDKPVEVQPEQHIEQEAIPATEQNTGPVLSDYDVRLYSLDRIYREHRLVNNSWTYLYHTTDGDSAKKILESQFMCMGSNGLVGAGIYFATNPHDTHHKLVNPKFRNNPTLNGDRVKEGEENKIKNDADKRVILVAKVLLGNLLVREHIFMEKKGLTTQYLLLLDYDSIYINNRKGDEVVIFNPDQIIDISIYKGAEPEKGCWGFYDSSIKPHTRTGHAVGTAAALAVGLGTKITVGAALGPLGGLAAAGALTLIPGRIRGIQSSIATQFDNYFINQISLKQLSNLEENTDQTITASTPSITPYGIFSYLSGFIKPFQEVSSFPEEKFFNKYDYLINIEGSNINRNIKGNIIFHKLWKPHKLYYYFNGTTVSCYNYFLKDLNIAKYEYSTELNLDILKGVGRTDEEVKNSLITVLNNIMQPNKQTIDRKMLNILLRNQDTLVRGIVERGLYETPRLGAVGKYIPKCGLELNGDSMGTEYSIKQKLSNPLNDRVKYRDCDIFYLQEEKNDKIAGKEINPSHNLPYFSELGLNSAFKRNPTNLKDGKKGASIFLTI